MSRARTKVAGCIVTLAVLGAGCSSDGGGGSEGGQTATTVKYDADKKVASPATQLRTAVTTLLEEQVLLTGIATGAVVAGQDPAPAVAALDQSNAGLADEIGRLYGVPTGQQFLALWKARSARVLEFAGASAAGDQARIGTAKTGVTAAEGDVAALLNSVNNQLTVDAMVEAFETSTTTLLSAVTAQAKKDPKALEKLKEASDEASGTAIVIVAAIVKDKGKDLPGDVDGMSAAVRTELAAKLQQHAYLAGLVASTALSGGEVPVAMDVLDANSLELSRAVGTVYGDDAAKGFLQQWNQHIEFILRFTRAAATGDRVGMGAARSDLDGYRKAFGAFLNSVNPNFVGEDVATDLGVHVDSLLAAIEAQAAKDPAAVVKLRVAASHMPETALYLATGIARQFPKKFG